MSIDYTIRLANVDDAALLTELSFATFFPAFVGTTSPENLDAYMSAAFNEEQLAKELADPQAAFFLIENSENVIGYLKLIEGEVPESVSNPRAIELSRLYVRQEFIAQKIGAMLMQKALEEGRARGYDTIFRCVGTQRTRQSFLSKMGFYARW